MRAEIAELRSDVHRSHREFLLAIVGANATTAAIAFAAAHLI